MIRPHIRKSSRGYYMCYHKDFRGAFGIVIHGVGESIKEAYEDWLTEMKAHGNINYE